MSLETLSAGRSKRPSGSTARTPAPTLPAEVKRQILRFAAAARPNIRKVVRTQPRTAELVQVFPGLLYALAMELCPADQRQLALQRIAEGAPLRSAAAAAGVPMWLRRLPPEAFANDLDGLPAAESFARRIATRLPVRAADASDWLETVRLAARAADDEFALWVARHRIDGYRADRGERLTILAAYAWHSVNTWAPASALVGSRWRPEMSPETAICAAKSWFNRVQLCIVLDDAEVALDPWLQAGEIDGYDFRPLVAATDLLEEARAMNNCADQYGAALVESRCRLFSVRCRGAHEATLEIAPHNRETGVLSIAQLKGRNNAPATDAVWRAALRWLAMQPRLLQSPARTRRATAHATAVWQRLMGPYRADRGGAPWLPAEATEDCIRRLEAGLHLLARDAGIRSWLFV
ncbi:MAG: hypothetical protein ACK4MF_04300 [Hyphomicrobiaceae bacterium]